MPQTEPTCYNLNQLLAVESPVSCHFGPVIVRDDATVKTVFSLFAPDAQTVDLQLPEAHMLTLPLEKAPAGWFYGVTDQAPVGSLYQFVIDGQHTVPDPASRFQPNGVNGPSQVINSHSFVWQDHDWKGRPWEEAVIYELHVGTFSPEGTYAGVEAHLDHLVDLGITTIEIMPLSAFSGERNWGYDGVYPFAPPACYGTPDQLKHLIQTAHQKGLMVLLDVVYNHFGPEGNYLHLFASAFFTERHQSPWGAGLNFDGELSESVRAFFIQNALYWLEEFHFDGLRLDAIHVIQDDSEVPLLCELAQRVHAGPGQQRHIHLVLENEYNGARWLHGGNKPSDGTAHTPPACYTAQWNDDVHHCLHVLATGQTDSYYVDYADAPVTQLIRALTDGFAYQGESSLLRKGETRGEASGHLPSTAFVAFFQNHDQVGNHPYGSRISVLAPANMIRINMTLLLLMPQIPMLFMGEEWQTTQPFPFFCDFHDELAKMVTEGRREEFSHCPGFDEPEEQALIPDPNLQLTFQSAVLNWPDLNTPNSQTWLAFYRQLLQARHQVIIPLLKQGLARVKPVIAMQTPQAFGLYWDCVDANVQNTRLWFFGNWQPTQQSVNLSEMNGLTSAKLLAESREGMLPAIQAGYLPAQSAVWLISAPDNSRKRV